MGGDSFRSKCLHGTSQAGSKDRAQCKCLEGYGGQGQCFLCARSCEAGSFVYGCGGTESGTCQVLPRFFLLPALKTGATGRWFLLTGS